MNSEASCCTITSRGCPSQSRSERTSPTGLKWAFSDSCYIKINQIRLNYVRNFTKVVVLVTTCVATSLVEEAPTQ